MFVITLSISPWADKEHNPRDSQAVDHRLLMAHYPSPHHASEAHLPWEMPSFLPHLSCSRGASTSDIGRDQGFGNSVCG
jgi:hypothetical protein